MMSPMLLYADNEKMLKQSEEIILKLFGVKNYEKTYMSKYSEK